MSSTNRTCGYILNPEDPETWGGAEGEKCYVGEEVLNENNVWACPHDAEGELCIFHSPVEEKDDEEVADAFIDVLDGVSEPDDNSSEDRRLQFIGAQFGEFDLSENPPEVVAEDAEIVLSHATVEGELNWSKGVYKISDMNLEGIECLKNSTFNLVEFGGETSFKNAEFGQQASFFGAEFGGETHFDWAEFGGYAIFSQSDFSRETRFLGAEFDQEAYFFRAEFSQEASFNSAEFDRRVSFNSAEFDRRVSFNSAEFDREASFNSVEFETTVKFSNATFEEGPDFSSFESLVEAKFDGADLTDATFTGVTLHHADFEKTLLSRATIFGADLRGAALNGAVLGDVRIDEETQFLGYSDNDSDSSPHTFSAIRSKPCCVYDPKYEENNSKTDVDKAKSVYRALEELASRAARPRLQSQCFVRRQDLQKDGYKRDSKKANSWQERLIASARYSRAEVARTTLLYGESPWRIVGGSIGFIIFAALVYPLGEWLRPVEGEPITYSQILGGQPELLLESLYFSTLTFTTLGMGDYQPMSWGQVIVTLNTALGAVLIALLVFVLGRRAAR